MTATVALPLPLDSPRWTELDHAYGKAGNIPALLRDLFDLPSADFQSEPWFTLWSSLAHQDDVYSASFAAIPHVIAAIDRDPVGLDYGYFEFVAVVEICRHKRIVSIPDDLVAAYFSSLKAIPRFVALASVRDWGDFDVRCMLSAVAASKGHHAVAEVLLELSGEAAEDYLRRAESD